MSRPRIAGLAPAHGSGNGGNVCYLFGTGLDGAIVTVGTAPALDPWHGSQHYTRFVVPPSADGAPVLVRATGTGGTDTWRYRYTSEGPAPVPGLTVIVPDSIAHYDPDVDGPGPLPAVIACLGTGYVPRTVVEVGGVRVPTLYLSGQRIDFTVDRTNYPDPGDVAACYAVTDPPGGGRSPGRILNIT